MQKIILKVWFVKYSLNLKVSSYNKELHITRVMPDGHIVAVVILDFQELSLFHFLA